MPKSFTQIATIEAVKLLAPLQQLNTADATKAFLKELGWDVGNVAFDLKLQDVAGAVGNLFQPLQNVLNATTDAQMAQAITALVPLVVKAFTAIKDSEADIENVIDSIPGIAVEKGEVIRRVVDLLLFKYLQRQQPGTFAVLHLGGIVEEETLLNLPVKRVQWHRLLSMFTAPKNTFNDVYQWNAAFNANKFLSRLEVLMRAFMIPGGRYRQSEAVSSAFGIAGNDNYEIRMPVFQTGTWPDTYTEIDINISPLPEKDTDNKAGLVIYPYILRQPDLTVDVGNGWNIILRPELAAIAGLGVSLRPPAKLEIITNLLRSNGNAADHVELSLEKRSPNNQLTLIFGRQNASRLGYKNIGFNLFLGLQGSERKLAAELTIKDLTLVINTGEGDGFVQKILSGVVLESVSDLTFGASNKEGFYFKGSSALALTLPVHRQLGPVFLDTIKIGVAFAHEDLRILLAVTFSAEIGPITASVKEIGVTIPVTFPPDRKGNLGPVNINTERVDFLPPSGAGLAVDASGLSGGGYLDFDRQKQEYAGILYLKFSDFQITAVGIISTGKQNNQPFYSIMINVGVEFDPGIQLPYNFTLKGVGGLLGIHRSAVVEVLRAGIRAKTLDSILFPEDPIQNAPLIISNMKTVFPPVNGRHIVAPMVKIGWANNLITADICILIELPSPVVIMLLGQIKARLPKSDDAVIKLNLDVLGVIELAHKRLSIDATLYDSKIQTYIISGDAALRLQWGENPKFAMSVGGFHPAFTPPPGFPSLRRLTLSLAEYDNLDISCKMYHAITANSVQFGCQVALYAEYAGAQLDGHLGFDTLIYLSPLSFTADMDAGVAVKYRGRSLSSVNLDLELSGPNPWRAKGEASFSVLKWDVEVDFNKQWGNDDKRNLPDLDPWPRLEAELSEDSSWGVSMKGVSNFESFLSEEAAEDGAAAQPRPLVFHPAASPEVREKTLPLGHELELFVNAGITGTKRFDIDSLVIRAKNEIPSSPGKSVTVQDIREDFASGQFFKLSNTDRLSKPSFEKFPAGKTASETVLIPPVVENVDPEFENILIDSQRVSKKSPLRRIVTWRAVDFLMRRDDLLDHVSVPAQYSIAEDRYRIVNKENMMPAEIDRQGLTRIEADRTLASFDRANPAKQGQLQVVAEWEL